MNVTVTVQDAAGARDEGTIIVLTGTDEETRNRVTFGADRRPGLEILTTLFDGEQAEVTAEVEAHQVLSTNPLRKARATLRKGATTAEVAAYLPHNYQITSSDEHYVYFEGYDDHGWTLDGYVIPRLASGLIWGAEVEWRTA